MGGGKSKINPAISRQLLPEIKPPKVFNAPAKGI